VASSLRHFQLELVRSCEVDFSYVSENMISEHLCLTLHVAGRARGGGRRNATSSSFLLSLTTQRVGEIALKDWTQINW
jgi:hypothetical protein